MTSSLLFHFSPPSLGHFWQNSKTEFKLCILTALNPFMNTIIFENSSIMEFVLHFCLIITRVRLFTLLKWDFMTLRKQGHILVTNNIVVKCCITVWKTLTILKDHWFYWRFFYQNWEKLPQITWFTYYLKINIANVKTSGRDQSIKAKGFFSHMKK